MSPFGPGRYDNLCSYVRQEAEADGAIVLVFNGKHGDGFACQLPAGLTITIPEILESMAAEIRASFDRGKV